MRMAVKRRCKRDTKREISALFIFVFHLSRDVSHETHLKITKYTLGDGT